jgi:hypothetical protein
VAYPKRGTRLLAGAVLVMTAALGAAGCTSTPATTASAGPTVSATEARQVYSAYVSAADRAAVTGNTSLSLSRVTGVQKATVEAQLKAAQSGTGELARYRYGAPTFYLPQPDGYPSWFVASVDRTLVSQPGVPGAPGSANGTAGVPLAVSGRVLMLFEQGSANSPWLLASTSQLPPGSSVPPLATNSAGYVATVSLTSGTQLASPQLAGPLQAAVVDDGPSSPAAKVVAAGNLTTGLYTAAHDSLTGLTAPRGDVYLWELEGSHYITRALRTADGGALVFYSMYLDSTVEVPAILNKGVVTAGPPITVPGYLDFLLPSGKPAPRLRVDMQQLLSFTAVDPSAGRGEIGTEKITVIAMGGGLDYADAS